MVMHLKPKSMYNMYRVNKPGPLWFLRKSYFMVVWSEADNDDE